MSGISKRTTTERLIIAKTLIEGVLEELPFAQPTCNQLATDCISRQGAIDLWHKYQPYIAVKAMEYDNALAKLPSVHPEKRTEERTKMHACDLISRHAAIDAVTDVLKRIPTNAIRAKDVLEALPSVQPEQKKGKWIEADDSDNRISGRCSVCGWESHMYEDDVVGMDYCPHCGAKMEE